MPSLDFDNIISFRLSDVEFKKINKVVRRNRDLFYNKSHFIRASIIKHLAMFDEKGKLKKRGEKK